MADNPNAFKLWFDEALVDRIISRFEPTVAGFDGDSFRAECLDGLDDLELKARVRQISAAMRAHLHPEYPAAIQQILAVLPPGKATSEESSDGFALWPYCDFIEMYGVEHLDVSMNAMFEVTQRFSAEFAVRPFLIRYPEEVLAQLQVWATHPNVHVRRWVSEGSRPRLPWGMRLQQFVDDPSPILPLLEALKHDPEEYVRRSVANNLNDIAKDHPDLVVQIAERWWPEVDRDGKRMVKHALRSLVKAGHPGALGVLGFGPPQIEVEGFAVTPPEIELGDSVAFELRVRSTSAAPQELLIDYAVHHVKANGSTSPKVFKWTVRSVPGDETIALKKNHSVKKITTRRYYPGVQGVEVFVNGESVAEGAFTLHC